MFALFAGTLAFTPGGWDALITTSSDGDSLRPEEIISYGKRGDEIIRMHSYRFRGENFQWYQVVDLSTAHVVTRGADYDEKVEVMEVAHV